jgi:hypothetical protein
MTEEGFASTLQQQPLFGASSFDFEQQDRLFAGTRHSDLLDTFILATNQAGGVIPCRWAQANFCSSVLQQHDRQHFSAESQPQCENMHG